jgi:hypothetical protein
MELLQLVKPLVRLGFVAENRDYELVHDEPPVLFAIASCVPNYRLGLSLAETSDRILLDERVAPARAQRALGAQERERLAP